MAYTRSIPAFFALYLVFNIGSITQVAADVSWDQTSLQVTQGEDVTITCTVLNADFFDVVRVSKQSYEGTHVIADREDIKKQFLETKRYNVTYKSESGSATLTLMYKGIRGEDAGKIICEKLGGEKTATVDLDVIVPIDRLYLIQKDGDEEREIGEEEEITLVEGKETGVKCRATVDGSLVAPSVTVNIASEDKTSLFTVEPGSDVIDPNGGLGKNTANTNVTYTTNTPNPDFNGKTLTCRAETENGQEEETVSTILNVQYVPRVTCDKYKHFGIVGESISIKCAVRSNPPSSLMWQWEQGDKTQEIDEVEDSVQAEEEEITDDEISATLAVSDIQSNHFTNYILTATNKIGTKTITVALTQGSAPRRRNKQPKDQPNNPGVATKPTLTTTPRPAVEVPQGVSGRGNPGPMSCVASSLVGLLAVLYCAMSWR